MIDIAKKYFEAGLSVIPVGDKKLPIGKWKDSMTKAIEPSGSAWNGAQIGLVCGVNNIEAIDIDCKYDTTGLLYTQYKKAIAEIDKSILEKLTVQKTRGNGYHFIYKCAKIEGNKKLANRPPTEEELKENPKDKGRVLIETRGQGGYILCAPSPGYEVIYGDLLQIKEITTEDRDVLFAVAATFNQVFQKEIEKLPTKENNRRELGCFDDYNSRANIGELLTNNGWKYVGTSNKNEMYKRPGATDSKWSAGWHVDKKIFYVFTSSSDFEAGKGYSASGVYCKLECRDDWKEAAKRLYDAGYGERINHIKDEVDFQSEEALLSFLATAEETAQYIFDFRDGKIEIGKPWGIPDLDEHFPYKQGTFNAFNGFPNVGKSTILYYLVTLSTVTLNLRWVIYSTEANHLNLGRRLVEFRFGKPTKEMSNEEIAEGVNWLDEHFLIIKEDNYWTYLDLITAAEAALKYKRFDCLLIDPYNSLKKDSKQYRMFGGYEYNYVVASFLRHFCKKYNISIFLNLHPQTESARVKPDKEGKVPPPEMADSEGGGVWGNRIDNFGTFHRDLQSSEWMFTQILIRKIKEYETGGKPTLKGLHIMLRMDKNKCIFIDGQGRNPMEIALQNKKYSNATETTDYPKGWD